MLQTVSETVIVAALKKGNLRRAVELMLESYQNELYGYCASHVDDARTASAYQQVVMTALAELGRYQEGVSVRAWLYAIARRVVLSIQGEPGSVCSRGLQLDLFGSRLTDPQLDGCLAGLEPAVREVLQLSLWHGLRLTEIAHVTARSWVEVRALAARGLIRLAADLQHVEGVPA